MPPKTLAGAGLALILAAIVLLWGLGYWAGSEDFSPYQYGQTWSFIQFFSLSLGGAGVLMMLCGLRSRVLGVLVGRRAPRIFPEMVLRNVLPLRRHGLMPAMSGLPNFGTVCVGTLLPLVFIFAFVFPRSGPHHGFYLNIRGQDAVAGKNSPWPETLSVYVDYPGRFYLNGQMVKREELRAKLQEELGRRMVWTVYFEAHRDTVFMDAAYCMSTIQGLGAKVVWITPRMLEEWKQQEDGAKPAEQIKRKLVK